MTDITYTKNDDWINKETDTGVPPNTPAIEHKWRSYRWLSVSLDDGYIVNNGSDTNTVTVRVVDGVEVARGSDPSNASVLSYDGDVVVTVDGSETTKTLSSGSLSFDLTTTKSAGDVITVKAVDLVDHPSESDVVNIEVTT